MVCFFFVCFGYLFWNTHTAHRQRCDEMLAINLFCRDQIAQIFRIETVGSVQIYWVLKDEFCNSNKTKAKFKIFHRIDPQKRQLHTDKGDNRNHQSSELWKFQSWVWPNSDLQHRFSIGASFDWSKSRQNPKSLFDLKRGDSLQSWVGGGQRCCTMHDLSWRIWLDEISSPLQVCIYSICLRSVIISLQSWCLAELAVH